MNAYELGVQKNIPAVLLYAFHQEKVLMVSKQVWNGLGGKLEAGESALQAAVREFQEEATCSTPPDQWRWLGQLHFPNFKAHKKEDWSVTVFVCDLSDAQAAQVPVQNPNAPEGWLEWIPISDVLNLKLWDGDRHFIPFILKQTPFQGTLFYDQGKCVRFELQKI